MKTSELVGQTARGDSLPTYPDRQSRTQPAHCGAVTRRKIPHYGRPAGPERLLAGDGCPSGSVGQGESSPRRSSQVSPAPRKIPAPEGLRQEGRGKNRLGPALERTPCSRGGSNQSARLEAQ